MPVKTARIELINLLNVTHISIRKTWVPNVANGEHDGWLAGYVEA